jgi:DNA-binding MarR family transcriptional regulator
MADEAAGRVERELTALIQRALRGPLLDDGTGRLLERPAYAVLARLHDDGPMRLAALATLLGLDPSTVSRQVQGLTEAGMISRQADPDDRRAARLELTQAGRARLLATRDHRSRFLHGLLEAWPAEDREVFADLLERFNADVAAALAGGRTSAAPAGSGRRP